MLITARLSRGLEDRGNDAFSKPFGLWSGRQRPFYPFDSPAGLARRVSLPRDSSRGESGR